MNSRAIILIAVLLTGLVGLGAVGGAVAETHAEADIIIEQPTYIDSDVEIERTDEGTIHHVEGEEFRLWLDGQDHESVERFGIADGSGEVRYDERKDYFEFTPEGNGTMTLFWVVDADGTEETLEATLRVGETDFVTRTAAEDSAVAEQASRFQEIEREVDRIAPGEDTDDVISEALTLYRFFESPLSTFFADIQSVIILLTLRPGGLAVLGTLLLAFLASTYSLLRFKNRADKQLRDQRRLDQEKREVFIEKAKKIIQQNDWQDLFPDDTAKSMERVLHRNTWQGFKTYTQLRSPEQTKGTILQLMGQVGYKGWYRVDDGAVTSAWVSKDGEGAWDDEDKVEKAELTELTYADEHDRAIIRAIPGEQLDLGIFDDYGELDPSDVHLPVEDRDIDDNELLGEIQPRYPEDFEDEAHAAECLGELMRFVENHPYYTDEDGHVADGRDLLSVMAELDTVMADEADFPVAEANRRMLFWVADEMSIGDKLEQEVERSQNVGYGGAD